MRVGVGTVSPEFCFEVFGTVRASVGTVGLWSPRKEHEATEKCKSVAKKPFWI